ncbi:hypothetical protein BSKO_13491 [Bryopsis sp. KO-2023]|nr:hypothetical protein BSKO_13491 [Bryopsis sp. KO-2023]
MAAAAVGGETPLDVLESRYGDSGSEETAETQIPAVEEGGLDRVDGNIYESDDSYDSEFEEGLAIRELNAALKLQRGQDGGGASSRGVMFWNSSVSRTRDQKPLQPIRNSLQKLDEKIRLEPIKRVHYDACEELGGKNAGNAVASGVKRADDKLTRAMRRRTDKSDRATVENVLDRRTRTVLYKMINREVFEEIHGCISTGKEANVYHAVTKDGLDLAVKIFKTSILQFKDRDRYVSGDFRFRHGYCKHNPRKMVQAWAEKELRNLSRIHDAGIPTAKPVELRMHLLVMELIGEDGMAAPRLKDVKLDQDQYQDAYRQLVIALWKLYRKCKLVHADFSEYNILYLKGECYIIDVSQGVDLDHPHALDFLKEDSKHLNDFFTRQGIATLTVRELFDFSVDPTITDENMEETLDHMLEVADRRGIVSEDSTALTVFQKSFIPRKMEEVLDYERDQEKIQRGEDEGIYYQTIMGLKDDLSGVQLVPRALESKGKNDIEVGRESGAGLVKGCSGIDYSSEEGEYSDSQGEEGASEDGGELGDRKKKLSKEEIRELRKANKKVTKEFNKVRRQNKTPKKLKKRQEKKGRKNRK